MIRCAEFFWVSSSTFHSLGEFPVPPLCGQFMHCSISSIFHSTPSILMKHLIFSKILFHGFTKTSTSLLTLGFEMASTFPSYTLPAIMLSSLNSMAQQNFNTEYTERLHIDLVKDVYQATNFKDEFSQMTLWLERKEKVLRHDQYINWRLGGSPVPEPCEWSPPGLELE